MKTKLLWQSRQILQTCDFVIPDSYLKYMRIHRNNMCLIQWHQRHTVRHLQLSIMLYYSNTEHAYSGDQPLFDTQVVTWKSWVRCCFGAYFRTTSHDLLQQWQCSRALDIQSSLPSDGIENMLFPRTATYPLPDRIVMHQPSSPSTTYMQRTHATHPSSLRPTQLVLTA